MISQFASHHIDLADLQNTDQVLNNGPVLIEQFIALQLQGLVCCNVVYHHSICTSHLEHIISRIPSGLDIAGHHPDIQGVGLPPPHHAGRATVLEWIMVNKSLQTCTRSKSMAWMGQWLTVPCLVCHGQRQYPVATPPCQHHPALQKGPQSR